MLSVLIPVYNYDINNLVQALRSQAISENITFEIIVLDDGSENQFRKNNRRIASLSNVIYDEETKNTGRSKIRNKLAETASYDHLLFLDCDSGIPSNQFLRNYLSSLDKAAVIYGGTIYNDVIRLSPRMRLHWLHGIKREQNSAQIRNTQPNRSFKTNNFLVQKDVLKKIEFNEKIKGYGHEDTLFGYELDKLNIAIHHIENPVVHLGLESNEEFLRKTRESIKNLKRIMSINGNEKKLIRDITLLSWHQKIRKFGMDSILRYIFAKNERFLRKNLIGKNPRLFLFDLYKLGYLSSLNGDIK